jgi:enoyl-CoA hydratase/carnithine racemase
MSDGPLLVSRDGGLDVLVLDSQHNRNALSARLLMDLVEQVERSAAGPARGLVLDHAGPVFCAGVDLREREELGAGSQVHSTLLARLLASLWAYPKAVLCRIGGPVRGGGMGLVACSDIVVASAQATFAYSEVRVGVAPALVAAVAVPKAPLGALLPWLITGEPFDAATAQRIGLVSRVADDSASLDPEIAAVRAGAPGAIRAVKRLSRALGGTDVEAAIADMEALSAELFAGDEALEGIAAFRERRPASWMASA